MWKPNLFGAYAKSHLLQGTEVEGRERLDATVGEYGGSRKR